MLDKLSANQRLMLAVVLSIVFFVGYTSIFPPVQPKAKEATQTSKDVESKQHVVKRTTKEIEITPAMTKVAQGISNTIVTVKNKNFILKIDTLGRIGSKVLLKSIYNDKNNKHEELIPALGAKPLFIRFADDKLNQEAIATPYVASASEVQLDDKPQTVVLTQSLPDLTIKKELTFYADGHYDVTVSLSKDKRHYIYLGQRPQVAKKLMAVVGDMVYTDDDIATIIKDGDSETRQQFSNVALISAFDQYSATIMYGFSKDTLIVVDRDKDSNPVIYFDALQTMKFHGYLGKKNYKTLKSIKLVLTNAIEYGWFTFAAKPLFKLLSFLHGIFGNWGWAIIALISIIRIVLYPLTYKGMVSMQKMKDLAPKLKELKERYKGDPQRLNAATMEMYKKHGANPLGGCLPMILQIPIFFSIYRVLLNAVELQGAPWILWVHDLSKMDHFYILPVLMGVSMYYQQRITPNNFTDPMQEKVFKFLPIIFTFFFVTFPSGLVLYWLMNNIFSIIQQFIVNAQMKNARDAEIAIAHNKNKGEKND